MANETPPPSADPKPEPGPDSPETLLLRKQVAQQRNDAEVREAREAFQDALKNRVSVAAIILTTALSFIGNVKGERGDASGSAKASAEQARRQGAELWAYYQTKLSERTSLEIALDRVKLDLAKRGLAREDPEARLEALRLTGYEERIRDSDHETSRVFYRVQELEKQEDVQQRESVEPGRSVGRYELGSKLITLALILLSVTILSNKRYLLWAGVLLGSIGLFTALDGYFLFF